MDQICRDSRLQKYLSCGSVLVLLALPVHAHAYLDPTTGSMIISAIVGLFASLVLAIKTYWYRIKSFFKRNSAETDADDGTA